MGSVIDYIECPNCGHEAYNDFYYKTGEEYINCQNCGYHKSATIINRDKALNELTDEDWEIHELKDPWGAYRLKMLDSVATQCGSFDTKEAFESVRDAVAQMENVEYFSISKLLDNGEILVEYIIDNTQDGKSDTGI